MNWTEEAIRAEIRRLDEKTGLHGATLPIMIGRAKTVLGTFSVKTERLNGKTVRVPRQFTFSGYYFHHPELSDEFLLGVIRHEYAHYMDFVRYGQLAHGKTFRACCHTVGAYPRSRTKLPAALHSAPAPSGSGCETPQARTSTLVGPGMRFVHPVFGVGTVESVKEGHITLRFDRAGVRTLEQTWLTTNCQQSQ